MATRTSTQSGNFSAGATWGGTAPVDGDSFVVASGHTVTIDTGISVPATGYIDSYVNGILQSQSGANTTLRMNGRLYINGGGTLHLRSGAKIQINGSSAEQHGIWIENADSANCIMEGSDGMPTTTLSANVAVNALSFGVASASNFAVGEWIAVYDHQTTVGATNDHDWQHTDEGFWIHDISSNTIYVRNFVGPEDVTVSSASGSVITVTNSKVFRQGQYIIFGTGANRNLKTISSINYATHEVTCNSSITGTVTGVPVYISGSEKGHLSGDKVRKMATITTASSSSSANSITVASAAGFQANDDIWIEWRSEADSTTDYVGNYDSIGNTDKTKHTISSIVGTTINLTTTIGYNVVSGALIHRMTRDVICETVATNGTDYAFFYSEYYTSNYNKKLILKDVYFKNWGNDDSSVQTGVVIRGYNSTDSLPVTLTESVPARGREPWIEGVVLHNYPENTHRNDWGGIWIYDARYAKPRCCFVMNSDEGFGIHYEPGASVANCIATACRERGFRLEGSDEWYEYAYLYASRCRYGVRALFAYEAGLGAHDIIGDALQYGVMAYSADGMIQRSKFTGLRYGHLNENSKLKMLYCYTKTLSGLVNTDNDTGTPQAGSAYTSRAFRGFGDRPMSSFEHNFEIDKMQLYGYNFEARWDIAERAWRFFRRYDNSSEPALGDRIFIPANTTVRLSGKVKLAPGFSGTYPYLFAHDVISGTGEDRVNAGAADASIWAGKRYTAQFSADAATDYEEEQITIASKPYSRIYYCGVYSSSSNAAEGYWVKDLKIRFDKAYEIAPWSMINDSSVFDFGTSNKKVRSSFTETKKRLGG